MSQPEFQPHCLPIETWPSSYRSAWNRALQPEELFGPQQVALAWREASLIKTRKGFGVWISWIQQRLMNPNWKSPATLVTQDHVRAYVGELQSFCAPNTVFCRIQELYDGIRILAPAEDWSWLSRAVRKLRSKARPVREKLSRLKPADVIEKLGFELMSRADNEIGLGFFTRALLFRDGFAIALLIRRPFRLRNFAGIRIHIHLVGDGLGMMAFSSTEMKSKRSFEVAFPENLRDSLRRYLEVYRPFLLRMDSRQQNCDALWISREGRAVDAGAFSKSIARRTKVAFGRDLTPHLFRDASVTTLVRDAPASALLTKTILGHSSIDVTNKHYNQALMIDSSRRYADVVETVCHRFDGVN
jgi:hypothetical protein